VLAYPDFSQPFILTTDASKVAVAAVLSQFQDGVERPLAYVSRQLSKPEQAYSSSKLEMLALVWATKHYRCYLLGRKCSVRTDHAALTYLRKFADHIARLMRWSLKLADFGYSIEHREGKKIPHVDALSRHVGAVLQVRLDPETVRQEQGEDKFCRSLKPGTHSSERVFHRRRGSCIDAGHRNGTSW
jgi:hypothetical protein